MDVRGRVRRTTGRYTCAMLAAAVMSLMVIGAASREAVGEMGVTKRAQDAAVGASVAHPAGWYVEHERYTYDGTYGYTLWRPDSGAAEDHGGTPAARVAWAYDVEPAGIEKRVRERISAYPDLKVERKEVPVGEKKLAGVAVGPIPGSTPSVEVYVEDKGSVYQINLYGEDLDPEDEKLLSSLRFDRPSRSVASLGLKDGKKAESFYRKGNSQPSKKELEARRAAAAGTSTGATAGSAFRTTTLAASSVPTYDESQIEEGCWRSASTFFFFAPPPAVNSLYAR